MYMDILFRLFAKFKHGGDALKNWKFIIIFESIFRYLNVSYNNRKLRQQQQMNASWLSFEPSLESIEHFYFYNFSHKTLHETFYEILS